MNISELTEAPPSVLDALPVDVLLGLQNAIDEEVARVTKVKNILGSTLSRRFATGINKLGVTRITVGGIDVVVDIPKKVTWDADKLDAAVEQIKSWGEDIEDFVELSYKVSETKFNAWPPSISDVFAPARTVENGKPKITLVPSKKAEAA